MLYLRDLGTALMAWIAVWFVPDEKIKRRISFLEEGVHPQRKRQIPYKILLSAYNKKIKK